MRTRHLSIVLIILAVLTGCGSKTAPVMPEVVGLKLDVALSDIERAGFSDKVEIVGGGFLGVIDKGNWTVCEQEPAAGQAIVAEPRVVVDRTCGAATTGPTPSEPARTAPTATSTPSAATTTPALETPRAEPTPSVDPMICETRAGASNCKFGQTAIYTDNVRSGEVKLEITVEAPVEFEPSKDARVPYDLPLNPVNVYFPVTIKKITAPTDTMILTQATNAQQGSRYDGIHSISDGDVQAYGVSVGSLADGESKSVKEGFSMTTLDGVKYTLAIDGQAGYSIHFTR